MAKSVSYCQGHGSLRHNNRDFIADNIDPIRTHLNQTFVKMTVEEAYTICFETSIADYDERQKRNDRKIGSVENYIEKVKHSKNGENVFYENVIQVGDMFDSGNGTADEKVVSEILTEYIQSWNERNPNLFVFNAVLHMDEKTPHLHVDYIPLADGYQRGMSVRNSLDRALKQQGIKGKNNKAECATINWQEREKDYIEQLMNKRGIERKPATGLHRSKKSVEDYKTSIQIVSEELDAEPKIELETKKLPLQDKVIVSQNELNQVLTTAKKREYTNKNYEKLMQEADKAKQDAYEKQNSANRKASESQELYKKQQDLNKICENQEQELNFLNNTVVELENRIDELRVETCKDNQAISKLKEQVNTLKSENLKLESGIAKQQQINLSQKESLVDVIYKFCEILYSVVCAIKVALQEALSPSERALLIGIGSYCANTVREQTAMCEGISEVTSFECKLSPLIEQLIPEPKDEPQQEQVQVEQVEESAVDVETPARESEETREEAIARRRAEVMAKRLPPTESIAQAEKRRDEHNAGLKDGYRGSHKRTR